MKAQPAAKPRSLAEFAAAESIKRGPKCWVCNLPPSVRVDIETSRRENPGHYTLDLLARYLRDELKYTEATMARVRAHFGSGHANAA